MPVLFAIVMSLSAGGDEPAEVPLQFSSSARFASVEQGAEALMRRDAYLAALSRFDLQSRLQTAAEVTVADLQAHLGKQVLPWEAAEQAKVRALLAEIRPRLEKLRPVFPREVLLIKTTGQDEGNAAYCRGAAIVLPRDVVARPADKLREILQHELFHVLSSQNPDLRRELYGIVGFRTCPPLALPEHLRDRKITNPDAPLIDCYAELKIGEKQALVAPVLYASAEKYDADQGGSFFRYLTFKLMALERHGDELRPALVNGKAVVFEPRGLDAYYELIGRNTTYIIHPDEILADNFVLMLDEAPSIATPRIVESLRERLRAP